MSEAPFKIIKLNYLDYIGLVEKRDNTLYIVNNDNETFSLFFKDKPIEEEKKEQLNIGAKEIVTVLKPYSETFSLSFNGKHYQIFGDGVASGQTFSQTITRSSFPSGGSSYTLSNFSSEGEEGIPGLFGEGNIYLGAQSYIQFNLGQKPFLRNIAATTYPIIKIKVKMAATGTLRSVGFRVSSDQICDSTNEIGEPTETKQFTSNGEVLEWLFGVEENVRFFQFVPGGNTNIESFEVITNNGVGAMEVDHKFVGKINKDGDFEFGKLDNATKEIIPGGIKINKDGKLEGQGSGIIPITWQELKNKRNAGLLMPGTQYRIIDYVTTTVQEDTQSAGHPFDLIVVADSVNKLNENARAIQHDGDTYFANSKLEVWQLKYCLDNDVHRFAWADNVNGKGVIYRLIDEWNNDVPYDFKNMMFLVSGEYIYTFHYYNDWEGEDYDLSLNQHMMFNFHYDEYTTTEIGCHTNIIRPYYNQTDGTDLGHGRLQFLNFITFRNFNEDDGGGGLNTHCCYSNFFDFGCRNISFGKCCSLNSFGCDCRDITTGNDCNYNRFGKNNRSNTLEDKCEYISFGDFCEENTIGDRCISINFGNSCFSNTFSDRCFYSTIGDDCRYLRLSVVLGSQIRYISVDSGVQGASSVNKFNLHDTAIMGKDYKITFKKSASGKYLMLWATDTGTMTGKVKATSTAPTWSDIV